MAPSYVIEDDSEAPGARATHAVSAVGDMEPRALCLGRLSANQAVSSFSTDLSPVFCYGDRGLSDTPCRDVRTLSACTSSLSICPPQQGNVLDNSGSPVLSSRSLYLRS